MDLPIESVNAPGWASGAAGRSRCSAGAASSDVLAARSRAARPNTTVQVNGEALAIVSEEEAAQAHFDARTASARTSSASIGEARAGAVDSSSLFATIDQIAPQVEPASRAFLVERPVEGGNAACRGAGCAMFAGRAVRVNLRVP